MARQRLGPVHCTVAEGTLNSAERGSALKHHISALFAADKGRHPFTVGVANVGPLLGKRRQTLRPQVGLDGRSNAVQDLKLVVAKRSPGVTFDAARALARTQVAHKCVRKNFI
jgi:hypothetical protein